MTQVRTSKAVVEQRVSEVANWIVLGLSKAKMIEQARSKWDVGERALDDYKVQARTMLAEQNRAKRAENMAVAIARHEKLWSAAFARNEFATAAKVLWNLCKLQGLDVNWSVADLEAVLKLEQLLVGKPTSRHEVQQAREQIRDNPRAALIALAGGSAA